MGKRKRDYNNRTEQTEDIAGDGIDGGQSKLNSTDERKINSCAKDEVNLCQFHCPHI